MNELESAWDGKEFVGENLEFNIEQVNMFSGKVPNCWFLICFALESNCKLQINNYIFTNLANIFWALIPCFISLSF